MKSILRILALLALSTGVVTGVAACGANDSGNEDTGWQQDSGNDSHQKQDGEDPDPDPNESNDGADEEAERETDNG